MDGLYTKTVNGPELCHSALAEACEKEVVARILRGDKETWEVFSEWADGYELSCVMRSALVEQSDADVAMGELSLGLEKLAKEYAVGYVAHAADKGNLEDLGQELGVIEDNH